MKTALYIFLVAMSTMVDAATPFRTVIPMQVVCVQGGPEGMMQILLEKYNEKPVHAMDLSIEGISIQMFISENKNNPSSSVFLHSPRAGQTCIFWTAKDYLRTIETESLPAKTPEDKSDA